MTALELLWHCCAGDGRGWTLFRFEDPADALFVPARSRALFEGAILGQVWDRMPSIHVAPMREANNYREHLAASCLWARVESGEAARRLEAFRPEPTIVLRDGKTVRRTALWALTQELEVEWVRELNRRLQHRFGAPKKHAEVDFAFHPPGTVIRRGRAVEVVVERVVEALYGAREVAGHLPQSPDPDAWAKAQGRYAP